MSPANDDGHPVSPQWTGWRKAIDLDEYEARFTDHDAHGEADCIAAFGPATVLDAGCGTGRVAMELHRRGIDVVGVDLDADMLERARRRAANVEWQCADLASFDLGRRFDVVAMPGNVLLFCRIADRRAVVQRCAAHVADGGVLIAGFSLKRAADSYTLRAHDDACSEVGFELVHRWATWDRVEYDGGDYAVSVHRHRAVTSL
jgi:2-polyprenyl-3-methyl-5-hydroxy-6-metoxy-1,4-benzoquinol methylase